MEEKIIFADSIATKIDILSSQLANTTSELTIGIDNMWLLVAGFLVMFMQPGFAMVEAGFTRSKNTANILMKNLMDFSIGSILFWLVGYSIMYGKDIAGIFGIPNLFAGGDGIVGDGFNYGQYSDLFFQTVFCATAATIVSGAMAERTEFKAYLIFTIVISIFIYPVSGHWKWGLGWLDSLGFHDFAGSSIVHAVGGWLGLTGAAIIGPRIGKYDKDGKVKAIPGHNLLLGALGVFILWFGWFGFNPGSQLAASSAEDATAISHVFLTTNMSAAVGGLAA